MDQIIQQSLAGKRFGLMGFETPESDSIIAILGTVRGIGHVIGAQPLIPGLSSFSPFDACFINASATASGEQPSPIEMITREPKTGGNCRLLRGHGDRIHSALRPQPRIHFAAVPAAGTVAQDTPCSQIR